MTYDPDDWVCRIPRADLRALAADTRLTHRERVLMALQARLYENHGKSGGVAEVSQPYLVRATGLNRRSVRRAMTSLLAEGPLEAVRVDRGHTTAYRLGMAHTSRHGAYVAPSPGTESAPSPDQIRAIPMAHTSRHLVGAYVAPSRKEEEKKNSLKKEPGEMRNGHDGAGLDPVEVRTELFQRVYRLTSITGTSDPRFRAALDRVLAGEDPDQVVAELEGQE